MLTCVRVATSLRQIIITKTESPLQVKTYAFDQGAATVQVEVLTRDTWLYMAKYADATTVRPELQHLGRQEN